jgi:hypothetical protein
VQVSAEQAVEILRTWQTDRSWVAMAIEDNLVFMHCRGSLRAVGLNRVEVMDAGETAVYVSLTLESAAKYVYRVVVDERAEAPYQTLSIGLHQCLTYLAAFRVQPLKKLADAVSSRFCFIESLANRRKAHSHAPLLRPG